ncbi:MAG: biotin/lipoyl-binding protein, partial [Cohaesibacter sp.]|nr:biotin/lipoyl-binding protein [Cohaesibacter sp.]
MAASGFAWDGFAPRQKNNPFKQVSTKVKYGAAAAAVLLMFFPVHLTVLAEAEIVPKDPSVIRAPMNGIVDKIAIVPNQKVDAGQVLFQMDDQDLRNERLVAVKTQQGLAAQYRQMTRQALIDAKGKARLTILAARIKEKQAQVQQLDNLLERTQIVAPRAATVVMDDAQDWIGRPVQVGERIMALADETQTEIEAWLPVADAIELPVGA